MSSANLVIRGGDILGLYHYGFTIFEVEKLITKINRKNNLFEQVTYTLNNQKDFSQSDLFSEYLC